MQQINSSWVNSLFNRKDKEIVEEGIKTDSRRDMKLLQKSLITVALYLNPSITAGEFARFHNQAMKDIK